MEVYIGMGVSAASCTLAVISEKGRKPKGSPVETNGQTLDEVCRRADPAGRPSASCRNAAADCNGLLRRDLSVTDQERESGHFYFGENRTLVLCSDIAEIPASFTCSQAGPSSITVTIFSDIQRIFRRERMSVVGPEMGQFAPVQVH